MEIKNRIVESTFSGHTQSIAQHDRNVAERRSAVTATALLALLSYNMQY